MASLDHMMQVYADSHRDPRNKFCHKVGISLILLSLLWLAFQGVHEPWAWWIFGIGWFFQLLGHAFEKSWPEFLKNPLYLFIGPIYFFRFFLNGIRVMWGKIF